MKGIIVNWIDTLASIPADWLLCDGANSTPNLLGKYLLSVGAAEDPGTTGGATTHTHDSPAHGHTQDTHNHTGTTAYSAASAALHGGGISAAGTVHNHTYTTASTIATNQDTTVTIDSTNNDPSYYKIAPIIDNSVAGVKYPINSLIFWGQTTLPNGWSTCDGSGGTPDLRNKFLKCVDTSENPGSTGGSATHTHSGNSHNHTQDSHTHTVTTGSGSSCTNLGYDNPSLTIIPCAHTHTFTSSTTTVVNQASEVVLDSINKEPTFKKLLSIKNIGVANRPKYAIVLWTGTIINIPLGYVLCDGTNGTPDLRDYFIKGANDSSELGVTGGNSVHGHTANSHNHIQDSHTHNQESLSHTSSGSNLTEGGSTYQIPTAHASGTSNSTTATNQATTITINNCSSQANYPPYYKVAYIMQDRELDIGAYAFIT